MGSHQCPPALQTIKSSVSLCSIELVINLRSGRQRLQLLLGLCHLLGAVAPSRQHRPPLCSGRRAWRTRTTARLGISRSFSQTQTLQMGAADEQHQLSVPQSDALLITRDIKPWPHPASTASHCAVAAVPCVCVTLVLLRVKGQVSSFCLRTGKQALTWVQHLKQHAHSPSLCLTLSTSS